MCVVKNDSWKSRVIYLLLICNTGVLLVSNGKSRVISFIHALMIYTNSVYFLDNFSGGPTNVLRNREGGI